MHFAWEKNPAFHVNDPKEVRIIKDGERVPEIGEILEHRKRGGGLMKVRIVRIDNVVRMHKQTMYAFTIAPVRKKKSK